jgi:hypothetical protein
MSKRRPPTAHTYLDSDGALGLVRYDGDPAVWERLARKVLDEAGCGQELYAKLAPPRLGWWRLNVCSPDHYLGWKWTAVPVDGPGPGRFQGAEVRFRDSANAATGERTGT